MSFSATCLLFSSICTVLRLGNLAPMVHPGIRCAGTVWQVALSDHISHRFLMSNVHYRRCASEGAEMASMVAYGLDWLSKLFVILMAPADFSLPSPVRSAVIILSVGCIIKVTNFFTCLSCGCFSKRCRTWMIYIESGVLWPALTTRIRFVNDVPFRFVELAPNYR